MATIASICETGSSISSRRVLPYAIYISKVLFLLSHCRLHPSFEIMSSSIVKEDLCSSVDSRNLRNLPNTPKRSKSPSTYRKPCDLCHASNDVLVRCTIDKSSVWYFVCTKSCWQKVSGGAIDGNPDHPYYRYGGMWKSKHAGVSAKKPKRKKPVPFQDWQGCTRYIFNDKVSYEEKVWICRRSHTSSEAKAPSKGYGFWKEAG